MKILETARSHAALKYWQEIPDNLDTPPPLTEWFWRTVLHALYPSHWFKRPEPKKELPDE